MPLWLNLFLLAFLPPATCNPYPSKTATFLHIVGRREKLNMKREAQKVFLILTAWILLAFLAAAPKITGGRMGTVPNGDKCRAFPADFFRNLRNFLSFSSLTTDYRLLPLRPRSFFGAKLSLNRAKLSLNKANLSVIRANLSLKQAILSLPEAKRSLKQAILSLPKRHLLSPGGELHSPPVRSAADWCRLHSA